MSDIRGAVETYVAKGWQPVRLRKGEKIAFERDWPTLTRTPDDFASDDNVGVRFGPGSGGLVDVDLDYHTARLLVSNPVFQLNDFPEFGRESAPAGQRGHRLAIVPDAPDRSRVFRIGTRAGVEALKVRGLKPTVVELRGSRGSQTAFPPSVIGNDRLVWSDPDAAIPTVSWEEANARVGRLAFAALAAALYPTEAGNRDAFCCAAFGALLDGGVDDFDAQRIVDAIAHVAGDDASRDLVMQHDGEGLDELLALLGLEVLGHIVAPWLGIQSAGDTTPHVTNDPRDHAQGDTTPGSIDAETLGRLLDALDPCAFAGYYDFTEILHSAHHATGGDMAACKVFIAWAARNPDYGPGSRDPKGKLWSSILRDTWKRTKLVRDDGKAPVFTLGTLLYHVREAGHGLLAAEVARSLSHDGAGDFEGVAVDPAHLAEAGTEIETDTDPGLTLIRASDVKPEPLNPLWPGRVYLGKLTTFAGNPGEGKSQVTVDMCARISTGADWPDGSGPAPHGHAIIIAAEDEPADTIIPRLMAAGADLDKIGILEPTIKPKKGDKGGTRMIDIGKDLTRIDRLIRRRHPDTRVVILDTINSFLGGADNYRDTEVRNVLGPFKEWCERRKIAGIIVTHFRKDGGNGGGGNAMSRIMGSTAFAGLARSVWAFIPETSAGEPTGRNVMAVVKQNVTAKQDALAFRFVGVDVAEGINAPKVEWDGFVAGTADDLLRAADRGASGTKSKPMSMTQACQVFLVHELNPGPRLATEVMEAGLKANYTRSMINDAKKASGIESFKEEGDKRWWWRLPQIEPETEDRT